MTTAKFGTKKARSDFEKSSGPIGGSINFTHANISSITKILGQQMKKAVKPATKEEIGKMSKREFSKVMRRNKMSK